MVSAPKDNTAVRHDHRAFLRALPKNLRYELTEKSNGPGLLWLLRHLFAIVLLGWLISQDSFFEMELGGLIQVALMVVQGIMIVFLFTLLHETIHETPFRSRWLNIWIGRLCGFAIVLPPFWFKLFHFEHHRHTHISGKDPELDSPLPERLRGILWRLTGFPVWRGHIKTLFSNGFGRQQDRFVTQEDRAQVRNEARWMCLGYMGVILISVAMKTPIALSVWVIPALLGQPFLRIYLMAEHNLCSHSRNMFDNTRTTLTSPWLRRLAWNMPYHVEHHVMPGVPFHKLPRLHELTRPHLRHTEKGYTRFLWRVLRR